MSAELLVVMEVEVDERRRLSGYGNSYGNYNNNASTGTQYGTYDAYNAYNASAASDLDAAAFSTTAEDVASDVWPFAQVSR